MSYGWNIPGIFLTYDFLKYNIEIFQAYDFFTKRHMPGIYMAYLFRVFLSYARNIPGIFLVYSCTFETQQFWLQQNRDWNAAAHIISIARVFNVHHSTRRPHWAHVGPGRDPHATAVASVAEVGTQTGTGTASALSSAGAASA